jgi:hypothetical protein
MLETVLAKHVPKDAEVVGWEYDDGEPEEEPNWK